MSDIPPTEIRKILEDVKTPSLKSFDSLKSSSFPVTENAIVAPAVTEFVAMPPLPEKLTEEQLIKYNESVNEVIKGVVVRAQIVAEKNGNQANVKTYNDLIESAIKREIITPQELESRVIETKIEDQRKENKIRAEAALKDVEEAMAKVEAALKNFESFNPEEFSDIYSIYFELNGLLQTDLDPATKSKVENAKKRLDNVITDLENRVGKFLNPNDKNGEVNNPLKILSGFFAPKLSTSIA